MPLYRLKFHPGFILQLETAIAYYNGVSKATCVKFKSAVNKQLILIRKNPRTRSVRYDDIRFARVEKFPYAIHFSIDADATFVLVHALTSDHQDSETQWKKRF